jgi:tripartite ATP-independent transporter DctM subunit
MYLHSGTHGLEAIGSIGWNSNTNFTLTAVPLFILMGQIIMSSGLSEDFFRSMSHWLRRVPGGLLPGSIVACSVFAATTGSSVATAAAVGSVAVPEMKKKGYDMPFAAGTLAAGGTLGILIPPSICLILYSSLENVPVTELFAASLIPGLLLAGLFIVYILIRGRLNSNLVGEPEEKVPVSVLLKGLLRMLPVVLLVCFVVTSIYAGIATPTEAAALGVCGALIVSAGRLTPAKLYRAARSSVQTTTMVLGILLGAQFVSFALVNSGANRAFTDWIISHNMSKYELLVAICVVYILLGDFVEGIGMMLMTMPVLFPVAVAAGFDPVWFGVVVAVLIELGQITPPVGLNLFVIRGFDRSVAHGQVVRAAMPYAGLMVGLIVLLAAFPGLALWLVHHTAQSAP